MNDCTRACVSFLIVSALLALFAAFSFFSPLNSQNPAPWPVAATRVLMHVLPVCPPLIVAIGLRFSQVWAWYVGVFYMAAMFALGLYLSFEHFIYILSGNFIPPIFLLFSVVAAPPLYLLLRKRRQVLQLLHHP